MTLTADPSGSISTVLDRHGTGEVLQVKVENRWQCAGSVTVVVVVVVPLVVVVLAVVVVVVLRGL